MKYTISPSGRDLLEKNSTIETDSMRITKFSFGVTKMDKIDFQRLNFSKDYVKNKSNVQVINNFQNIKKTFNPKIKTANSSNAKKINFEEVALKTFKEKFSNIERNYHTKIASGLPIFPIPHEHEKKIVYIDNSF